MDLAYTLRYQAFSVPVLKGWTGEENPSVGPGKPFVFPGDDPAAGLTFATPSPAIEAMISALNAYLRAYAVAEGLPPDTWEANSSTRNLGAKKMEAHALQLRRDDQLPVAEDNLRRTFAIHKVVANVLAESGGRTRYSEGTTLGIRCAPIPLPVDELQDAQRRALDYQAGTDSPVEYLIRRDGCTREDAERRVRENLALLDALGLVTRSGPAALSGLPGEGPAMPEVQDMPGMSRP